MLMRGDVNRLITENIQPVIDHLVARIAVLEEEVKELKEQPKEVKRGPGRPKKSESKAA